MRHSNYFGGLFLIGLGILSYYNYWWPGILFALGASMILGEVAVHKKIDFSNTSVLSGLAMIGIGIISLPQFKINIDQFWPVILIGFGILLLASAARRR